MLNFQKAGKGKMVLVFLHGWGKDLNSWDALIALLSRKYTCVAIDLPGFGKSRLVRPFNLNDYALEVKEFLRMQKLNRPVLVGHSFGGRVGIKIACQSPEIISKLILINSSGIERKSVYISLLSYLSVLVPSFIKNYLGPAVASADYRLASGPLRETVKKVVSENVETELSKIRVPTLIIWGEKDNTTPLWQGKLMEKLIRDAELVIVKDADHGLPYRKAAETAEIILDKLDA